MHHPISSLIAKSEKALQKLAPGTWQHSRLADNLEALRFAYALMSQPSAEQRPTREQLAGALPRLASMLATTCTAQAKFQEGSAQHSLLRNRADALKAAERHINAALDGVEA